MKRKDFIQQTGRGIMLAGLAVVTGILFSRHQVSRAWQCTDNYRCRNCSKLSGCTLPEAELTRNNGKER